VRKADAAGKLIMTNEIQNKPGAAHWLNKAEIADHYKCSERHINKLMERRVLPFLKMGKFVRFDLAACDRAMRRYETRSVLV
jgi:hypothetical protein